MYFPAFWLSIALNECTKWVESSMEGGVGGQRDGGGAPVCLVLEVLVHISLFLCDLD